MEVENVTPSAERIAKIGAGRSLVIYSAPPAAALRIFQRQACSGEARIQNLPLALCMCPTTPVSSTSMSGCTNLITSAARLNRLGQCSIVRQVSLLTLLLHFSLLPADEFSPFLSLESFFPFVIGCQSQLLQ